MLWALEVLKICFHQESCWVGCLKESPWGRKKPKVHPLVRSLPSSAVSEILCSVRVCVYVCERARSFMDELLDQTIWCRGALFKNLLKELCWDSAGAVSSVYQKQHRIDMTRLVPALSPRIDPPQSSLLVCWLGAWFGEGCWSRGVVGMSACMWKSQGSWSENSSSGEDWAEGNRIQNWPNIDPASTCKEVFVWRSLLKKHLRPVFHPVPPQRVEGSARLPSNALQCSVRRGWSLGSQGPRVTTTTGGEMDKLLTYCLPRGTENRTFTRQ